jgi:hypothetical protein
MGITALAPAAAAAGRDMALDTMAASDAAMGAAPVGAAPSVGGLDMAALASAGVFQFNLTQQINGSGLDEQQLADLSAREARRAIESFVRQMTTES